MCFSSSDTAEMWAEKQAASEADAFESALKRLKAEPIVTGNAFEVDDKYEQAYRQGFEQGSKSEVTKELKNTIGELAKELMKTIINSVDHISKNAVVTVDVDKVVKENAELRDTVRIQSEQILQLRECINRNHEDFYE